MKATEARRLASQLKRSPEPLDIGQLAYAAIMLVANEIPSNFRDDLGMERNWRRLADAVDLDPDELADAWRKAL